MSERQSWAGLTDDLVAGAMGRKPATRIIHIGRWFNVHSGEIIPYVDITVLAHRIADADLEAEHAVGPETNTREGGGRNLISGLGDGHIHVEPGLGDDAPCASASTVIHATHHRHAIGIDTADPARAAGWQRDIDGGVVIFRPGTRSALLELPSAGLMSDKRPEVVAAGADRLAAATGERGDTLNYASMQHTLLALPAIPERHNSDTEPVAVMRFQPTPPIVCPAVSTAGANRWPDVRCASRATAWRMSHAHANDGRTSRT